MGEITVTIKGNMDIFFVHLIEKETDRVFKGVGFVRTETNHYLNETEIIYKPNFKEIQKGEGK